MFKGIEGARAWLAWAVVGSHLFVLSGLHARFPVEFVAAAGDYAVKMFIIISGFVITNLVMMKNEPYGLYIARRALRLYPAYLICLAAGIFIYSSLLDPIVSIGFANARQQMHFEHQAVSFTAAPWAHIIAHLTMLHGMIPNSLVDEAQYMFDPPAWSLSLEWQFYLIAPFVIALLRGTERQRLATVIGVLAAFLFYKIALSAKFYNPSLIIGVGPLFLLGIVTRLVIERLPTYDRYPWAIPIGLTAFILIDKELIPPVGWVALILYLRTSARWAIFDSKLAARMGDRSYSVYISHVPVILIYYLMFGALTFWPKVFAIIGSSILTVILVTEVLYRFVEAPAIRWGKRLGKREAQALTAIVE